MSLISFFSMRQRTDCAQGIARLGHLGKNGPYQPGMRTWVCRCLPAGFLRAGPSAEREAGLTDMGFVSCRRSLSTRRHSVCKPEHTWDELVGTWTSEAEMKGSILYSWPRKLFTPTWIAPLDSHCEDFGVLLVFSLRFTPLLVQDTTLGTQCFKLKGLFPWKFK